MFSNFIYFIIVLLIYNTYQPSSEANFPILQALPLFLAISLVFFYFTRQRFAKLEKSLSTANPVVVDQRFTSLQTRHSIFAVGIFAFHIYVLNLPAYFLEISFFRQAPTILAIIFIGIFVLYLAMIWGGSHHLYQKLYRSSISRQSYIFSNISFSIPVLLPWLILSGVADLMNALPFQWPKSILATTWGQTVYFLIFLLIVAVMGPAMIQYFWRCKPVEPGYYRNRIEELCQQANLRYSQILYWPIFGGRMITAGVMGLVGRFRYILVTEGLLRLLTPEEIDSVVAHEIGHVKRYHLMFYLFFFIGYPFLYYAFYNPIDLLITFAGTPNGFFDLLGLNSSIITITLFNLLMITTFLIYFRYLFGYFMRNFERQADTYVYSLLDSGMHLISTFQKIAVTSSQPMDKPNWHHFSIKERIDFLVACEANRESIQLHNRKIRLSILMYLLFLLLIGVSAYYLNFGASGQRLKGYILERSILNEIHRTPESPDLFGALGMIYYNRKEYASAIKAYEKSLQLSPQQDEVLNNLSWLLATCEDPIYRNPSEALRLAQRAAALKTTPEILDTLAECYFINGELEKAVEVAQEALVISKNRPYYQEQLEKFKKALQER